MQTELAERRTSSLVSPAAIGETLEAVKRFEEFKTRVLKPTDFVSIKTKDGEKKYVKKSGWMLYALACQLSLEKRDERRETLEDGTKVFHYTYRAIAPSGRFADADGSASSSEREFNHEIHDVRALAQTRACNRAVSNLVAGGEVSAEELEGGRGVDNAKNVTPPATQENRKKSLGSFSRELPKLLDVTSAEFYEFIDVPISKLASEYKMQVDYKKDADGYANSIIIKEVPDSKKQEISKKIDVILSKVPGLFEGPQEEGRLD
jgi:hypothetical protein